MTAASSEILSEARTYPCTSPVIRFFLLVSYLAMPKLTLQVELDLKAIEVKTLVAFCRVTVQPLCSEHTRLLDPNACGENHQS